MNFFRARETNLNYIMYEKSFTHNTALIASEGQKVIGVFEYEIKNSDEAEVINFNIFEPCEEDIVFKGFIDEMAYWNPYLKRIIHNEEKNIIDPKVLMYSGFRKNSVWILNISTDIRVFKIDIKEITPEQLTVDEVKLARVNSWIEKPEDIVVSCVKIGNKIVVIDGHSRLVAAYNKGFRYVYAYLESDNDNLQFYKTCMQWCEDQRIYTIKDLAKRVVTPEEHEKLWISRCQTYLTKQRDKPNSIC